MKSSMTITPTISTPKFSWPETPEVVHTISSSSSTSSCGSSSGYNSDTGVCKIVTTTQRSSGLKKSGEFFNDLIKAGNAKAVGSMVMPRRLITSPNTNKRASLSVTDL